MSNIRRKLNIPSKRPFSLLIDNRIFRAIRLVIMRGDNYTSLGVRKLQNELFRLS